VGVTRDKHCCHDTDGHFEAMAKALRPQGHIVSIVESQNPPPLMLLFSKKASFSWELMFTKARYKTPDMSSQRDILDRVAELVDEGVLRSTLTRDGGKLTADATLVTVSPHPEAAAKSPSAAHPKNPKRMPRMGREPTALHRIWTHAMNEREMADPWLTQLTRPSCSSS
jgi:hypothetical protein